MVWFGLLRDMLWMLKGLEYWDIWLGTMSVYGLSVYLFYVGTFFGLMWLFWASAVVCFIAYENLFSFSGEDTILEAAWQRKEKRISRIEEDPQGISCGRPISHELCGGGGCIFVVFVVSQC